MRAVTYDRYGGVDQLRVTEVAVPAPGPSEVLVAIAATGINLSDWEGLRGRPAYARLAGGLLTPRRRILGSDIAGTVVGVGEKVERFGAGDEVYGDNLALMGGFAEYAVAPESALAHKPAGLSFAEASAVPQPGAIAACAVALAAPGQRVLINGAGGGSGVFAIQLAKSTGLHVTAVDNAGKLDFLRDLGADEVIDYRTQDFTRTGKYDLVIDLVAHRSVFAYRRALAPGGRYAMVGGTMRALLRVLTVGRVVGALTGTKLGLLIVRQGPDHFAPVADRILSGEIAVHIDSSHPLAEVPAALERHGTGRALGKVVIAVRPGGPAGPAPTSSPG